ncbi:MAG TPA: GntR family transcriptional regulator [Acidimicrobiales bacterium]|nr:GntR family transcriptional regulator [Acidimicrobiales bacterium]
MPIPDSAAPARRPPARVLVMEQLQRWIEDGTLQPGEVLKDTDVAAKLGVSRTPVREVFQRLEELGLLVTTSNSRTQVAPARPQDASALYEPLAALHAVAVELAVARLQPDDLEQMAALNESMLDAVKRDDAPSAMQADEAIHRVVLERAANPFLLHVTDWLTVHARRLNTLYFTHHGPSEDSYQEHKEIIAALGAGDAELAAAVTRRNMLRTVQVLRQSGLDVGS